jgi:hypothetical protein
VIDVLWAFVHVLSIVAAFTASIFACLYAYQMFTEIPSDRRGRIIASLFPYLVGVIPGSLTERGQEARSRLVRCFIAMAISGLTAWLTGAMMESL